MARRGPQKRRNAPVQKKALRAGVYGTIDYLSEQWGFSRPWIMQRIRSGYIPAHWIGSQYLIRLEDTPCLYTPDLMACEYCTARCDGGWILLPDESLVCRKCLDVRGRGPAPDKMMEAL